MNSNMEEIYPFEKDPYSGKLYALEELESRLKSLRSEGKKIVLTNGCFDLIHVGHLRALRHARSLGDVLVVAVNSDASVKKYKNPLLPIIPEKERLEVLSSLEVVNYLVLFEETSVEKVLRTLQPHIHAKGRDYSTKTVPEKEVVLSYGGAIAIVGDPKDHSTTDIIQKIQKLPSR